MSEILALKGRLQAARDSKRNLEAQAALHIRSARQVLDPYLSPVTKMRDEEAAAAVNGLQTVLASLRETERLIVRLEDDIGK